MTPPRQPDDDGSVYVTEEQFRADPGGWCRRADDVPSVAVVGSDGEIRFVIVQQREPLEFG